MARVDAEGRGEPRHDPDDRSDDHPWADLWGPLVAVNVKRARLATAFLATSTFIFLLAHQVLVSNAAPAVYEQVLTVRVGLFGFNLLAAIWLHAASRTPPTRAIALQVTALLTIDTAALGVFIGLWQQLHPVLAYQTTVAVFVAMAFCLPTAHAASILGASYLGMAGTVLLTQPNLPNLAGTLVSTLLLTIFAAVLSRFVSAAGLRQRSAHLTIERQRRRLAEASTEAQRLADVARAADRAKSEFLANMSHETRTPMTAILGMMELAERTELSDEQRRYVRTTRESAASLLRVLEDILDLSKVEARRLELRPEPINPEKVVRAAVRALVPDAEREQHVLSVEASLRLPGPVLVDPYRLRQIVINLVNNAIKYTERGEIAVTLTGALSERRDGEDRQLAELVLTVRDTGMGVPAAKQGRVFEPFEQGDSSSTRRHSGVGLGLSICRELTRLMGGEIRLDSAPGEGSAFVVRLEAPLQASASPDPQLPPPATKTRPLRVLVAEDNRVNQRLLQRFLEDSGHLVTLVADGTGAIEALTCGEADRFDLALIDVQMPGADGTEVAQRRRAFEQQAGASPLPLVAVTARAMKGDREALLDAGLDDYLPKPFSSAELAAVIARVLASADQKP